MGCLEEEKSFSPAATLTALLPTEVSRRSLDQLANSTSLHLSFLVFSRNIPLLLNIRMFTFSLIMKCCYEPGNVSRILLACLTW